MIKIYLKSGEDVRKVLKRFKRLCEKEGITKDFKRHEAYESRTQQRRRKKRAAIRRLQKPPVMIDKKNKDQTDSFVENFA